MLSKFGFAPLSPYKMSSRQHFAALRRYLLIAIARFFILVHPNKLLSLPAMPPAPSLNNLPHPWVVIAGANVELEVVGVGIWLHLIILTVQHLIQLLHELNIDCLQEIWLLDLGHINPETIAPWHWDIEVFKKFYDFLIISLHLWFE